VKYWDEDGNFVSNAVALWHQWGKSSSGFVIGDDHANPSIIVLKHQKGEYEKNNGKLLVAAAEHGWRLEIKKSVFTENITAWEPSVRIVDKGATYARLVELSDGQILLFARMSNSAPNSRATYYYWVSDDSGQTWSEPKLLIDSDMGTKDAIYLELVTNSENNEIHFMFNIVKYNDLQSGKNRYQDIYYIYYDLKDDKWKKRNSDVVDLPLTPSKIDYVYKSNVDDWTYLSDIKIDNNGIPRLLSITDINRFEYEEITVNEHYFNDKWVTDTISYTGRFNYVNMASYDGNNTNMIYTFPEDSNGNSQMEIWRKKDGKWSKYVQITNDDYGHHARPVSIVGSESSLRVLWNYITMYEGSPYTNWKSMIMGYKDNLENDVGLGQDDK
jgi:hypothetical protein